MERKANDGSTAAHVAARKGHVEVLRALGDLGCPMAQKDKHVISRSKPKKS